MKKMEHHKIIEILAKLEEDSQKLFDEKTLAVMTAMLGGIFGFIEHFARLIQKSCWYRFSFILMSISIALTIVLTVYSHYYSTKISRDYQKHISKWSEYVEYDVFSKAKRMEGINSGMLICFISAISLVTVNIVIGLFN